MVSRLGVFRSSGKPHARFSPALGRALALFVLGPLMANFALSQATEKVLHSFQGGSDGNYPYAGVVLDNAGNLYGTTPVGGGADGCEDGCGTVFELAPSNGGWTETILHSFTSGVDGYFPESGLIFDNAGNLYGTTPSGGATGNGNVFELTPSSGGWTEAVLYSFTNGSDGGGPVAGLVFDSAGNLYGTASSGGAHGCGTVFKLTPSSDDWRESVLYSFTCGSDGGNPMASVIFDSAGSLYGTTSSGGANGEGTVFKLTPSSGGWEESVLHTFSGTNGYSHSGVVLDSTGNLYGTTYAGGVSGDGTAYELMPSNGGWRETVLHSFTDGGDGAWPQAGLLFDSAGNLYGTSSGGGAGVCGLIGCGTVFKLTPSKNGWTETVLHSFGVGLGDGYLPFTGGLVMDIAGNLYGTTLEGGSFGSDYVGGVVFEISPLNLLFPVKKYWQCGGTCTPQNAPINTVFDHEMKAAYECTAGVGGYGSVTAFTAESASVKSSGKGYGRCGRLYGYTNPGIASFIEGYNYTGNPVLYYDSHPGIDYNFAFGTSLYPGLNGCVTYLQGAAGVPNPAAGHVLAILPQPTEPVGGCQNAVNPSGYDVIYMHLSSYYDQTANKVMKCTSSEPSECDSGQKIVPCPTCAQQYEWVSTGRTNPIGYSGNFFVTNKVPQGWGGVGPHLHFEVDQLLGTTPRGVDPYGWCGAASADPYTGFTGLVNTTLWSQFALTCPGGGQ